MAFLSLLKLKGFQNIVTLWQTMRMPILSLGPDIKHWYFYFILLMLVRWIFGKNKTSLTITKSPVKALK